MFGRPNTAFNTLARATHRRNRLVPRGIPLPGDSLVGPDNDTYGQPSKAGGIISSASRWRSMPRTRTRQRRYSRRRRGRRGPWRARAGMPYKTVRVFKTVKYLFLNPGASGLIASFRLPVNSGNDPFGSAGSGQPLGWDQYSGLYERYAVVKTAVSAEMTSAEATVPICVGLNFQVSSTELSTFEHYKELPNTKFEVMTPDMDKVKLFGRASVGRFYGHRRMLSDDRLSAAIGADPTDLLYCHVFAQPIDLSTDTGAVYAVVTIYQTVVFFKPKTVARS